MNKLSATCRRILAAHLSGRHRRGATHSKLTGFRSRLLAAEAGRAPLPAVTGGVRPIPKATSTTPWHKPDNGLERRRSSQQRAYRGDCCRRTLGGSYLADSRTPAGSSLSQPAAADPRFIGPIDRHIVNKNHIFEEIFQKYL